MKLLNIIVCCDNKQGIGINNKLPWCNKSEMSLFKNKTIGKKNNCVIMGKNTYKSIPEKYFPLIDRKNIVLSSSMNKNEIKEENVNIYNTHYEIIEYIKNSNHDIYWIIGGASVYDFFLTYYKQSINEIHISVLNKNYNCDTFFPKINNNIFKIKEKIIFDSFTHFVYKNIFIHDRNTDYH